MFKRIIRLIIMFVLFIGFLRLGGYSLNSFTRETRIKNPGEVLAPITQYLPELPSLEEVDTSGNILVKDETNESTENTNEDQYKPNIDITKPDITTNPSNPYVDSDGNIIKPTTTKPNSGNSTLPNTTLPSSSNIDISYIQQIKINLDGKEYELSSKNTISFVKWLNNNYKPNSTLTASVILPENTEPETIASDENKINSEVIYTDVLDNKENLDVLVNSIHIVDKLPDYDDYDRSSYEKPVKGYKFNGDSVNRNDYAWKTSKYFDEKTFTYVCPYTGTVINDLDDKKDDKDYGNLDFDHIVPLRSTYIRGAKDWTDEQKNEYAYNQWIGVDVLNSANRSKSDKGPTEYLPTENIEDYCYSWLLICSYYKLDMTQEEIDICSQYINEALEKGDTVEHIGGSIENCKR